MLAAWAAFAAISAAVASDVSDEPDLPLACKTNLWQTADGLEGRIAVAQWDNGWCLARLFVAGKPRQGHGKATYVFYKDHRQSYLFFNDDERVIFDMPIPRVRPTGGVLEAAVWMLSKPEAPSNWAIQGLYKQMPYRLSPPIQTLELVSEVLEEAIPRIDWLNKRIAASLAQPDLFAAGRTKDLRESRRKLTLQIRDQLGAQRKDADRGQTTAFYVRGLEIELSTPRDGHPVKTHTWAMIWDSSWTKELGLDQSGEFWELVDRFSSPLPYIQSRDETRQALIQRHIRRPVWVNQDFLRHARNVVSLGAARSLGQVEDKHFAGFITRTL